VKTRPGLFSGDDRLQVVAFPPFLLSVPVGSQCGGGRDFLGLRGDDFLDLGAIHHREGGGVVGDSERMTGCRGGL
jgi:hypothetical protein